MLQALAVVVVNFGSSDLLAGGLAALQAEVPEATFVVVDNFSSVAEREAIRALSTNHGWRLIEMPGNRGFGGGVNAGVGAALAAGCSDLLVLNPDALVTREALLRIAAGIPDHRRALATPVIRTSQGRTWFAGVDLYLESGEMLRSDRRADHPDAAIEPWLTGACLWITKEAWEAVGEFDEEYFLYWEDVDYSVRARRAGCSLKVVEDATAVHDEGGTQRADARGPRAKSAGYYYYNIRNRMLFAAKHLDAEGLNRWRRTDLAQARSILLRGGRRQFLHPVAPVRAALRGLRDGREIYSRAVAAQPPIPAALPSLEDREHDTHGNA